LPFFTIIKITNYRKALIKGKKLAWKGRRGGKGKIRRAKKAKLWENEPSKQPTEEEYEEMLQKTMRRRKKVLSLRSRFLANTFSAFQISSTVFAIALITKRQRT